MNAERAFRGAISEFQDTYRATHPVGNTVHEIIGIFGGGARGTTALAKAQAGTTDTKSSEYKAARRSLERYIAYEDKAEGKQTRNPARALAGLRNLAEQRMGSRALAAMAERGITLNFAGTIVVSPDGPKETTREVEFKNLLIDGDGMKPVVAELEAGQFRRAFDEFNASMFSAWHMAPAAIIADVDDMDMQIGI